MRPILFLPLSVIWLLLPSCGKKAAAKPPQMPPAAVTFVPAASETVKLTRDLPGRIGAVRVAEIRARVSGILQEKTFEEGADVKAGDVLFKIDPAPLIAARESAAASLVRAEANAKQAYNQNNRYKELVTNNAISKLDADNSESAVAVADAEVLTAKAALATAELNLGYATVTAPISGRIGKAVVTEGALVGEGSATLMAVIQQLEPIYFDFTQPSSEVVALKRRLAGTEPGSGPAHGEVTLLLEDGSEYEHKGQMLFSEVTVDESTGMVTLRAQFPNPDRLLLPGMFARGRMVSSVLENVVTVPQRAVTRGQAGVGTVMVIDDQNKVQARTVTTGAMTGDKWVVSSGLKQGERVIIEGLQKAKPGAEVVPAPFQPKAAAEGSEKGTAPGNH